MSPSHEFRHAKDINEYYQRQHCQTGNGDIRGNFCNWDEKYRNHTKKTHEHYHAWTGAMQVEIIQASLSCK